VKHYSYDYVTKLQRMHQERLNEAMDASQRLLHLKEVEVNELHQKLQLLQEKLHGVQDECSRHNTKVAAEREEMLRSVEKQRVEISEAVERERRRCETEAENLRSTSEVEIERVRVWAEQQLRAAEDEAKLRVEAAQRAQGEAEEAAAQKLREVSEAHEKQVTELRRLLNNESERLTLAREEICELSMARGRESMEAKARLDANSRSQNEFKDELRGKLERLVTEFTAKEQDYTELINSLRTQQELERASHEGQLSELRGKVRDAEDAAASVQRRLEQQATSQQTEFSQLNETLDAGRRFSQKQQDQNRELLEMVRQLSHENGILRQEISLTENERRRMREELSDLKGELERADKLLYGSSGRRQAQQ